MGVVSRPRLPAVNPFSLVSLQEAPVSKKESKRPQESPAHEGTPSAAGHGHAAPAAGLSRQLPGWHPLPFLEEPAEFQANYSEDELAARQQDQLIRVPGPRRLPPVLHLAEVIGADGAREVLDSGQVVFHAVGDTGHGLNSPQMDVALAMTMDYHRPNPADHPAFFLHLGDVIYSPYHGPAVLKKDLYKPLFYQPYDGYPGKILAIPGNHDSNPEEDPHAIDTFQDNFCAPPPAGAEAATPVRRPMWQPGVYFMLEAPFVRILGLFSNGGEYQGVIAGPAAGDAQKAFLVEQLRDVRAKRDREGDTSALIVAVHHPPYSGGGHTGSAQMLRDLDDAFHQGGITPDAVLSGHAHNYQRFTRRTPSAGATVEVPYVVSGNGGFDMQPVKPGRDRQPVRTPVRGAGDDHSLRQYYSGYGYLLVTVTRRVLTIECYTVHPHSSELPLDSVTVDLRTHRITSETKPLEHPLPGEGRGHLGEGLLFG
jgi:Calcineurin-like phosphoesterase